MNLFINDIPIRINKPGEKPEKGSYNYHFSAKQEPITKAKLINHIWISDVSLDHLDEIIDLVDSPVPLHLLSLVISPENYESVKFYLTKKYKIIKAAGGVVRKKDKILMIYRLKKWDLPKGKREKKEKSSAAAVREVVEECNIDVKLVKKLCTTWHTYTMNKKKMLKKTRWYIMDLTDDSKMEPRKAEDIEELRWMNQKEVYHALENSYRSIRFVFEEFYRQTINWKKSKVCTE
ncbi:MAG: NUDIX domain-containing protein [Flammeovirgaceae bacterium]|nr:NUDIX domain-containing protein [Flammeovirgaceae bacterium]